MLERLKIIETRYNQIGEDLQKPEVVKDIKKMTSLMKEMSSLEKIVVVYHEYIEVMKQISDLKELTKDEDNEIREMATLDLEETLAREENLIEDLKILLIPKDPNDEKNVIVEIRGAAGGDEANIFAGDLFRMYTRFAESKGWKIEVLSAISTLIK
jgi:peptide chain release factor 1